MHAEQRPSRLLLPGKAAAARPYRNRGAGADAALVGVLLLARRSSARGRCSSCTWLSDGAVSETALHLAEAAARTPDRDDVGMDSACARVEVTYYRTFETAVDDEAHLFEFVVPMVPPSWNDKGRVRWHRSRLRESSQPTAVAVATLDVCAPADEQGEDYFAHWGLTHFLLDGHHKLEAASENGSALQLLSLLSIDASLASGEQVAQVANLRARAPAARLGGAVSP